MVGGVTIDHYPVSGCKVDLIESPAPKAYHKKPQSLVLNTVSTNQHWPLHPSRLHPLARLIFDPRDQIPNSDTVDALSHVKCTQNISEHPIESKKSKKQKLGSWLRCHFSW